MNIEETDFYNIVFGVNESRLVLKKQFYQLKNF